MDTEEKLSGIEDTNLQLEIPNHTLRFRERLFQGIFVPQRTPGRYRRYILQKIAPMGQIKKSRKKGMRDFRFTSFLPEIG
jgi:DNA-binding transcriptional MerR regulator